MQTAEQPRQERQGLGFVARREQLKFIRKYNLGCHISNIDGIFHGKSQRILKEVQLNAHRRMLRGAVQSRAPWLASDGR